MAARLPDDSVLGGLPSANSGRVVSTFDTSAPGRAAETLGQGITNLGKGIASGIESFKRESDDDALTKAKSGYLTEKVNLESRLKDATDEEEANKIAEEHAAAVTKYGNMLSGKAKTKWDLEFAPRIAEFGVKAKDKAFSIVKDNDLATYNDHLNQFQQIGTAEDSSPEDRAMAIEVGSDIIREMQDKRYLSAQEAQKRAQQWVTDYSWKSLNSLPPEQRLYTTGGADAVMRASESGNDPRNVNKLGYAGLYQYGAPRLETLGVYSPGSDEDLKGWSKSGAQAPGKWSGRFNIPGFPDIKTLNQFLDSPEAQEKVRQIDLAYMDKEIKNNDLEKYIGQTVGGVRITADGLRAMIHLGGLGGTKRALESDGQDVIPDANGTTVMKYARMFQNGKSDLVGFVSPENQRAMRDTAANEIIQKSRASQNDARRETATVQSLIADDRTSIANTGKPIEDLTADRVRASLGDEAAQAFQRDREYAKRYYNQTQDFQSITPEEIDRRLALLDPRRNGEAGKQGFREAQKWYEDGVKRRDEVMKQRQTDPASAVEIDDGVKEARKGVDQNDTTTLVPLGKARMAAQTAIGVPPHLQSPITKAEAERIALPFTHAQPGQEWQGMLQVIKALDDAFGPNAEPALAYMLRSQNVADDVSTKAARYLHDLAAGRAISAAQERALRDAMDIAAASGTVQFVPVPDKVPQYDAAGAFIGMAEPDPTRVGVFSNAPPPDIMTLLGAVPTGAREALLKNPDLAKDFDAKYGNGKPLSRWILGQAAGRSEQRRESARGMGMSPDAAARERSYGAD